MRAAGTWRDDRPTREGIAEAVGDSGPAGDPGEGTSDGSVMAKRAKTGHVGRPYAEKRAEPNVSDDIALKKSKTSHAGKPIAEKRKSVFTDSPHDIAKRPMPEDPFDEYQARQRLREVHPELPDNEHAWAQFRALEALQAVSDEVGMQLEVEREFIYFIDVF